MTSATHFPVIYLTGAPASGKSTAVKELLSRIAGLAKWDYGAALLRVISRDLDREVTYEELRSDSATLVSPARVHEVDEQLIEWVAHTRAAQPVVIDTHAATREAYGFRATPFDSDQWRRLGATHIFMLYCRPSTTISRIGKDAAGRLEGDEFDAGLHVGLQASVAITYGITSGRPIHLLETDSTPPADVARRIATLSTLPWPGEPAQNP